MEKNHNLKFLKKSLCDRVAFRYSIAQGKAIFEMNGEDRDVKAIEEFAKIGVVSTVCIFRPCLGTILEGLYPPEPIEMKSVFKRMYEVCLENRIPIGIAPNIKVSLVLLPEEGKYFLPTSPDSQNQLPSGFFSNFSLPTELFQGSL